MNSEEASSERQKKSGGVQMDCNKAWQVLLILFPALWNTIAMAQPSQSSTLTRQEFTYRATYHDPIANQVIEHDALWVRPGGRGPFPLVVISHGKPPPTSNVDNDRRVRSEMRPTLYIRFAEEMARRGWAVASFMRRGYGKTGSYQADDIGSCIDPAYQRAGERVADEFEQAVRALSKQVFIDPTKIVVVGQSVGGFGVVALSARDIPGLRAVINFAGGHGSSQRGIPCKEAELIKTFSAFGARARVPSLWLYAERDAFFYSIQLPQSYHDAFVKAGGSATFHTVTGLKGDGHGMIGRADAVHLWAKPIDTFLREKELAVRHRR